MEKAIVLNSRPVGFNCPVLIIAEAGVNHNGDPEMARRLVKQAKECGADCIKFQTFRADRLATEEAKKAQYQRRTTDPTESQLAMLRKLELPLSVYASLMQACEQEKMLFLSTPYDVEDVDFLESLDVPAFKIASAHITEPVFLRHVARKGRPVLLSTGMATLAEVDEAVRIIRQAGNEQVVLLQCTTNYPSAVGDANLRVIPMMREALRLPVGYSDHTQTSTACIAAVALGACLIEKHFTLDKTLPGPDHAASADPQEFGRLVAVLREVEAALGDGLKQPVEAECQNVMSMRRSIVAGVAIPAGTQVSEAMLTYKRPGTGMPPRMVSYVIGRTAAVDIPANALMRLDWLK